ncbi:hypothetical protein M8J76_001067 [Diaphorina citri]|nr:hypothetical protein M8J76_001067 [Diaphorina citri]
MVLGCRDGVHTVTVSARSRFPTTHQILTRPDVSFVTDLSISPQSLHMATASILSPSVHIWDLADLRVIHLIKLFSAPNYSVRWSPSGLHLAVATTGVSFKFYNLLDSSCNKWTLPRSYITSLVWSPDSRYVLFSTAEDPYVHFIQFESVTGIEDKRATPLLDTRSFLEDFDRGDNNFKPNNCNRTAPVDRNGTFNRRDCSNGNGFSNDDSFGSNDSTRSSTSRDQGSKNTNGCANRNDTYRTGCINKSDSLNRTDSFDSNDRNARTGNDDGSSMNDCRNDECNNTACMSNRSDSYSTDNCTDYDCNNEHDCRNIDSTTTSTNEDNCTNLTIKYSFSSIHYNSRTNCSNETNDFKRNYTRIIDFDRSNSCIQRNGSSAETDSNTIDGSFSAIDHKRPSCIGTKYDGSRTNCTNRNEEFTGSDQNCNSRVVDLGKSENCRNRYGRAARIDNDGLNKPYSVKGTFPTGTTAKRRFDPIHSLALDQSGRYLAVSFRHAPVIGLYRLDIGVNIEIRSRHRLDIWPAFGRLDSMDFMPGENAKSPDFTVLTLAWNNGVVQHFPIL